MYLFSLVALGFELSNVAGSMFVLCRFQNALEQKFTSLPWLTFWLIMVSKSEQRRQRKQWSTEPVPRSLPSNLTNMHAGSWSLWKRLLNNWIYSRMSVTFAFSFVRQSASLKRTFSQVPIPRYCAWNICCSCSRS